MNDAQIDYLTRVLNQRHGRLEAYWRSRDGMKQIARVGSVTDEPGPVAFLYNERIGSNYIALQNVGTDEIAVITADLAVWPD